MRQLFADFSNSFFLPLWEPSIWKGMGKVKWGIMQNKGWTSFLNAGARGHAAGVGSACRLLVKIAEELN